MLHILSEMIGEIAVSDIFGSTVVGNIWHCTIDATSSYHQKVKPPEVATDQTEELHFISP